MKNLKLTVCQASLFIFAIVAVYPELGCEVITQPARAEKPLAINQVVSTDSVNTEEPTIPAVTEMADAATIMARTQVPILCYHQIRDYKSTDSKTARDYIVPENIFRNQMQALADSGYHAILPNELYDYLAGGRPLPARPVMITFDDSRADQFTAALPELSKHGFKGVFFIMTVALNKPGYMTKEQVKQLSDDGHTIGSHTYDHKNVKTYMADDWVEQVQQPSVQLQNITGKPVEYFAYPFGLWNKEAIARLKDHDFKAVFQLSAKRDENDPLHSIRRIIVPGNWSGATMLKVMQRSFQ